MIELSAREAGRIIDVTPGTIRRYVINGILPAERRGIRQDIKVNPDDLREFAKQYNFVFDENVLSGILAKK